MKKVMILPVAILTSFALSQAHASKAKTSEAGYDQVETYGSYSVYSGPKLLGFPIAAYHDYRGYNASYFCEKRNQVLISRQQYYTDVDNAIRSIQVAGNGHPEIVRSTSVYSIIICAPEQN